MNEIYESAHIGMSTLVNPYSHYLGLVILPYYLFRTIFLNYQINIDIKRKWQARVYSSLPSHSFSLFPKTNISIRLHFYTVSHCPASTQNPISIHHPWVTPPSYHFDAQSPPLPPQAPPPTPFCSPLLSLTTFQSALCFSPLPIPFPHGHCQPSQLDPSAPNSSSCYLPPPAIILSFTRIDTCIVSLGTSLMLFILDKLVYDGCHRVVMEY